MRKKRKLLRSGSLARRFVIQRFKKLSNNLLKYDFGIFEKNCKNNLEKKFIKQHSKMVKNQAKDFLSENSLIRAIEL